MVHISQKIWLLNFGTHLLSVPCLLHSLRNPHWWFDPQHNMRCYMTLKSKTWWSGHIAGIGETSKACTISVWKSLCKCPFGRVGRVLGMWDVRWLELIQIYIHTHTYTCCRNSINLHFVSFSEDTIIVTGFGPFGDHKINASWETVKLLPSLNIEEEFGVKLIIREIPVTYDYIAENVPILWKEHNPMVCTFFGTWTCHETPI